MATRRKGKTRAAPKRQVKTVRKAAKVATRRIGARQRAAQARQQKRRDSRR